MVGCTDTTTAAALTLLSLDKPRIGSNEERAERERAQFSYQGRFSYIVAVKLEQGDSSMYSVDGFCQNKLRLSSYLAISGGRHQHQPTVSRS